MMKKIIGSILIFIVLGVAVFGYAGVGVFYRPRTIDVFDIVIVVILICGGIYYIRKKK